MKDSLKKTKIAALCFCLTANILSVLGFVLWCSRSDLSYELIMDRAFDIGWFGSLYLWSLLAICIYMFLPNLQKKSTVLNIVLKRPLELFYLMGIFFKLIQGSHFVMPATQALITDNSLLFAFGVLIDIYFLFSVATEVFLKKRVLHFWNIGMIVLHIGVFVIYAIIGKMTGYIFCELSAHIVWHMQFLCMVLFSHKEKLLYQVGKKGSLE